MPRKTKSMSNAVAGHRDVNENGGDAARLQPLAGEHYRGEPEKSVDPVEAGSLEKETLDQDAPYNKTYGKPR